MSDDEPQRPPIEKMITGDVIKKKKSLLNRFSSTFFGDDAANVMQFVVQDVLIPSARDLMLDMVTKGFERLLFGDTITTNRTRRGRDESIVSYGKFYRGGRERDRVRDPRDREPLRVNTRGSFDFDSLVVARRSEAQAVLSKLMDIVEQYEVCSVSDFYDMLGVTSEYTDRKYGWDNLSQATVEPVRGGYVISLPNPIRLD